MDGIHIACQAGDGQQLPAMAAGHVVNAAVVPGAVVQPNPAGQVGHGLGSRPVGIVLVPRDDSAMPSRFAKQLVMPKPHGATQQLAGRYRHPWMPQQIVEAGRDPPGAQRVKQHSVGIGRFVGVILIPEFAPRMIGVEKLVQFIQQTIDLSVIQDPDPAQVAVSFVAGQLLRGQPESVPIRELFRPREKDPGRLMLKGKIGSHRIG